LEPLSVVIQAGGNSSRMGTPKSHLSFLGTPLLERIYRLLLPIAGEVLVVCNAEQQTFDIPVRVVPDTIPGLGALGGLYTAMTVAQYELVAVVACDLPFANAGILSAGADWLRESGKDVAVPKSSDDFFEPLHAVYRRDVCREAILKAIREQKRRLISWFPEVRVVELDSDFCRKYDPYGLAFFNINTPEDFARAEALAKAL